MNEKMPFTAVEELLRDFAHNCLNHRDIYQHTDEVIEGELKRMLDEVAARKLIVQSADKRLKIRDFDDGEDRRR